MLYTEAAGREESHTVLLMDTVPDGLPDDFADGQCVGTGLTFNELICQLISQRRR